MKQLWRVLQQYLAIAWCLVELGAYIAERRRIRMALHDLQVGFRAQRALYDQIVASDWYDGKRGRRG